MIRSSQCELILGERDYIKVRPILYDSKGMFVDGLSVSSPDGCFGPLYVSGSEEILDIVQQLVKES